MKHKSTKYSEEYFKVKKELDDNFYYYDFSKFKEMYKPKLDDENYILIVVNRFHVIVIESYEKFWKDWNQFKKMKLLI